MNSLPLPPYYRPPLTIDYYKAQFRDKEAQTFHIENEIMFDEDDEISDFKEVLRTRILEPIGALFLSVMEENQKYIVELARVEKIEELKYVHPERKNSSTRVIKFCLNIEKLEEEVTNI